MSSIHNRPANVPPGSAPDPAPRLPWPAVVNLLAPRAPAPAAKSSHAHGGHGHDGGMTAVVLDLDEVLAFVAPRVSRALAPATNGLARAGARGINKLAGANTVGPAQVARAGARMAAVGGLATIGGGIFYAATAARHARHSAASLVEERAGWRALLSAPATGSDVGEASGADASAFARRLRARGLPQASIDRLVQEAGRREAAASSGAKGKGLACVAAAAMAATLLFSAEFLLVPFVPVLASLGGIALGIAIPTMAIYGLWSAADGLVAVWRGTRQWSALHRVAETLDGADRVPLRTHLNRFGWGLVWEGASAVGGVALAAGLGLQLVNGLVGISLLAAGSLGLELFASLRTQAHGVWLPEAAGRDAAPGLARDLSEGLAALEAIQNAEQAVRASQPSRLGALAGLRYSRTRAGSVAGLRERTDALLRALGVAAEPPAAEGVAAELPSAEGVAAAGNSASLAALVGVLDALGLSEAFEANLTRARPALMQALPAVSRGAPPAQPDAERATRRADLLTHLRVVADDEAQGEHAAAAFRAGLQTLWGPGLDRLLLAYGDARATTFARLVAGEPLHRARTP